MSAGRPCKGSTVVGAASRLQLARPCGVVHRRPSKLVGGIHFSAGRDQQSGDAQVAVGRRIDQSRIAKLGPPIIDVGFRMNE